MKEKAQTVLGRSDRFFEARPPVRHFISPPALTYSLASDWNWSKHAAVGFATERVPHLANGEEKADSQRAESQIVQPRRATWQERQTLQDIACALQNQHSTTDPDF